VFLVSANASGPVHRGLDRIPAPIGSETCTSSDGGLFTLTLTPRHRVRASTGGMFQLAGSARKLAPADLIFSDGFESGDTLTWSATVPPPGEMPGGAVMFFDAADCPSGWVPLGTAQGRGVVGVQPGGSVGGVQGSQLPNLGGMFHRHTLGGTLETTKDGSHNHAWAYLSHPEWKWWSFAVDNTFTALIDWDNGIDNAGSGVYPFAANVAQDKFFGTSDQAAHAHSLTLGLLSDTASITMPYRQLLACEKD